jgi:hypothetical protein
VDLARDIMEQTDPTFLAQTSCPGRPVGSFRACAVECQP